jgi:lysyl-tRNA synthetase class 2
MFNDFRPTADWQHLRFRAELLKRLRAFFDASGFLEVQTPILSADTVVDRNIDPFFIEMGNIASPCISKGEEACMSKGEERRGVEKKNSPRPQAGEGPGVRAADTSTTSNSRRFWLQTSPEFAMKRLLAVGAGPIYEVARVFRVDELGPIHNPEFTLVEWYRPGDSLEQGMQFTSDLCNALMQRGPADRISYAEAFEKYVGLNPHTADGPQLAAKVKSLGIEAPASMSLDDRDNWLDLLLVEKIQPHLGVERPALLYDYPASQAALAKVRADDPPVAERFELYASGIELANGYHELLDAEELRSRNRRVNTERRAEGKRTLPEESRLLQAMEVGLPDSVGVALGFDRLVMLAAGAKSIAEVMAFSFDRA